MHIFKLMLSEYLTDWKIRLNWGTMNPKDVLTQLGLDDKEAAVYMGLLELGEGSVLTISKRTGVKRPTAYLVLSELEAKGFVSRVIRGKKVSFTAQHPKKILTEAEIRLKEIRDVIPQFEAMLTQKDTRPRVMIYEGKEALDRAYDESFLTKGEILFLSNTALIFDVFQRTLAKQTYVHYGPDFRMREVLDDSEESRAYINKVKGPYHQLRMMPKAFSPFATDIGILENKTLITSAKKEYFTVKIESEEIANAFRAMFEAMWMVSKEAA